MLICPDCQSVNPVHHNFCQNCGRSLNHHLCNICGNIVEFNAENCPQCQANTGTYWWAIIEPTALGAVRTIDAPTIGTMDHPERAARPTLQLVTEPLPISTVSSLNGGEDLKSEFILSPWEQSDSLPTSSVGILANNFTTERQIYELELNPWDEPNPIPPSVVETAPAKSPRTIATEKITISDRVIDSHSLVATTYLDANHRYRLIDPVVIQLLTPSDSSQVRVIDRQPFCNSSLEILMEQQPFTLDNTTVSRKLEEYPQWQFWNSHGIPKISQAYIALQVSLPGTIPAIHDGWDDDGKTITVVEDRSEWTLLSDRWNDPQIPASQGIYWLDYTLKLWVALEPWQMRQSLLEVSNLLLDEDARICFQRLYPEPVEPQLQLADLAKLWCGLFDRAQREPSPSLHSLIQSIQSGEIERVEEVRSQLQQIAYELEPKQFTAPLSSSNSIELSNSLEGKTVALDRHLIDLENAATTHTGKKRDHNEDCFGIVTKIERKDSPKGSSISARGLYILCDGMGGHAGGEIASAMTVDLLREYFATHWGEQLPDEQTIREGIIFANEAVFEINQKNAAHGNGRMGTTLVLVLVQDRDIAVAHLGDSRCYAVTPTQGLIQLTLDHEVGQQQILRGVDPEIAYGRPDSYQLTQAIGPRDRNYIAPDIRFFELQEDTLILLASDGLTDNQLLEHHWFTNLAPLLSLTTNLQDGVDRLIDFANEYNGHDNITAIVVRAKMN